MYSKLLLLVSILCISNFVEANELSELKFAYPHRLSIGAVASGITLDTHFCEIDLKGTDYFAGMNVRYEYYTPEAFYFSAFIAVSSSKRGFSTYYLNEKINSGSYDHVSTDFIIGYTKLYGGWVITPYVGIGSWIIEPERSSAGAKESMGFNSYGVKCDYSLCQSLDVGMNLKIFRSFTASKHFEYQDNEIKKYWESPGLNLSTPVTYHYGKWDTRIEPFFTTLCFEESQFVYGANINFGYNF